MHDYIGAQTQGLQKHRRCKRTVHDKRYTERMGNVSNKFNVKNIYQRIGPIFPLGNPSKSLVDIFDIKFIADITHSFGVPLVVDSTLATPVLLKPLSLGADIVVHSLSKYMGDGEVIGGAILGKKDLIDDLKKMWFRDTGPCMSPDTASLLLAHIESLTVR